MIASIAIQVRRRGQGAQGLFELFNRLIELLLGGASGDPSLMSATSPTMVSHGVCVSGVPRRRRLPMGSEPGQ